MNNSAVAGKARNRFKAWAKKSKAIHFIYSIPEANIFLAPLISPELLQLENQAMNKSIILL
jgi:hypothetical protein